MSALVNNTGEQCALQIVNLTVGIYHFLKPLLFELLGGGSGHNGPAGIELTESFAMWPTAAVSGFYFGHPQSQYFGVAKVGQDQLADYATRRNVDLDIANRWLRPNLES